MSFIRFSLRTIFLIGCVVQISYNFSQPEKPSDAYDLYWDEPITPESIQYASGEITKNIMNTSVDPCDDFYEYACGNFETVNPLGDLYRMNIFKMVSARVKYNYKKKFLEFVNGTISAESSSEEDLDISKYDFSEAEIKLKKLSESCLNREQIKKDDIKPLTNYFETLDGWPFSELDKRSETFDWLNLTAHLNQLGISILFSTSPDMQNMMTLEDGDIYLQDQTLYNITNEFQKKHIYTIYGFAIKSIFKRLGVDVRNMEETINEIIDFEFGLVRNFPNHEVPSNKTEITLERLYELVPNLDWKTYFSTVYRKPVELSDTIFSSDEDIVKQMAEYLLKSKPDIIAKYSFFMYASSMDRLLTLTLYSKDKRRLKKSKNDISDACFEMMERIMPKALSAFFVRTNDYAESKIEIENIFGEIKNELYDFINRTFWIDTEHKILANMKLDIMKANVAYEDDLLSHETLNKEYSEIYIKSDSFIENVMYLMRHFTSKRNAKIGLTDKQIPFEIEPHTVNAFYNQFNQGQMEVPAGILNPPMYHYYAPGWLKYGGIGVIIGHELVHGFDSENMLLDTSANLQDFKSLKVIGKYYARSVCMSQQYSKYLFKETNTTVDGSLTLDENISDNGGSALALEAYRKWLVRNPDLVESEKIPGLDLSPEQLFFVAHAQTFCESVKINPWFNFMQYDTHAPLKFRIIGTVSNSDSFSNAFNCPFGAPMNPVRKCTFN